MQDVLERHIAQYVTHEIAAAEKALETVEDARIVAAIRAWIAMITPPRDYLASNEGCCLGFILCYGIACFLDEDDRQRRLRMKIPDPTPLPRYLEKYCARLEQIYEWKPLAAEDAKGELYTPEQRESFARAFSGLIQTHPLTDNKNFPGHNQHLLLKPAADDKAAASRGWEPWRLEISASKWECKAGEASHEALRVRKLISAGCRWVAALFIACLQEEATQEHITRGICKLGGNGHACHLRRDAITGTWWFYNSSYPKDHEHCDKRIYARPFDSIEELYKEIIRILSRDFGFRIIHFRKPDDIKGTPFQAFHAALRDPVQAREMVAGRGIVMLTWHNPEVIPSIVLRYGGIDLEPKDYRQERTALCWAVLDGDVAATLALLRAGADPCVVDKSGDTVLHMAARFNYVALIEPLLTAIRTRKDILMLLQLLQSKNKFGFTPAQTAAHYGHVDIVRLFLSHVDDGPLLLSQALEQQDKRRIRTTPAVGDAKKKLEEKSEVAEEYSYGALCAAIKRGDADKVRVLLDAGIAPDHPTLVFDKRKQLHFLEGPDTPLTLAISRKQPDIVQLLLFAGAKIDSDWIYYAILCQYPEIDALLFHLPADQVRQVTVGGHPLLHWAIWSGEDKIVRALLELGVDPQQPDDKKQAPLQVAREHRNNAVATLLLQAGADPASIASTPIIRDLDRYRTFQQDWVEALAQPATLVVAEQKIAAPDGLLDIGKERILTRAVAEFCRIHKRADWRKTVLIILERHSEPNFTSGIVVQQLMLKLFENGGFPDVCLLRRLRAERPKFWAFENTQEHTLAALFKQRGKGYAEHIAQLESAAPAAQKPEDKVRLFQPHKPAKPQPPAKPRSSAPAASPQAAHVPQAS